MSDHETHKRLRVFVDGQAGTTGLMLATRLGAHPGVSLLTISEEERKDPAAKQRLMDTADVVFLCLPDEAARADADLVKNPNTRLLDASSAHRTQAGWVYGFPELSSTRRAAVAASRRISVPGCHATGFVAAVYPLVSQGLLPEGTQLSCTSLTGYSGGGKSLIERYETNRTPNDARRAPRPYALGLRHKHLPEMQVYAGLDAPPIFYPVVGDMERGMLVSVPIAAAWLSRPGGAALVWEALSKAYAGSRFVRVMPLGAPESLDEGFLDPTALNGTNELELFVFGHESQALVVARLDNLGKGASGAAIQCMNLACGFREDEGILGARI